VPFLQRYEYTKLQRASQGGYGSGGTIDFRNPNDGKPRAALRLTEERLQRLNEIGFEWSTYRNRFKRFCLELHSICNLTVCECSCVIHDLSQK